MYVDQAYLCTHCGSQFGWCFMYETHLKHVHAIKLPYIYRPPLNLCVSLKLEKFLRRHPNPTLFQLEKFAKRYNSDKETIFQVARIF